MKNSWAWTGRFKTLSLLWVLAIACSDGGGDPTSPAPPAVATVTISPASPTITVAGTMQLTATPRDAAGNALAGRSISWTSSNPAVATVDATGMVRGVAPGQATITATAAGRVGSATVSVAAPASAPVESVTVSPDVLTLLVGATQQLNAILRDAAGNVLAGRPITWTTSDAAIATVDAAGLIRAVAPGQATITATSEGKVGSAAVLVAAPAPVGSVTVSPNAVTLVAGGTQQLTATLRDAAGNVLTGRSVTWASSAPTIATVSTTGLVTGVGLGSATITATSEGEVGSAAAAVAVLTFTSVSAGGAHTCALTAGGSAYCWGRGESGQLGVPSPTTMCLTGAGPAPCTMVAVAVQGGLTFAQLAGGGAHTCGLTSDGSAYCWGSNGSGQLGDNSFTSRNAPVPVATAVRFVSIDAGAEHTCGLASDGTAYCWGRNDRGQLGDGTTTTRSSPVAVTGNLTFQLVRAGGFSIGHTCALATNGGAYCWGDNERGQLGNGTSDVTPYTAPGPVSGGLTFTGLTAGLGRHTCGLTGTGAAHCWGENSFGALGNGSAADSPVPVAVSGGLSFIQLSAGGFIGHTCGRTGGGTAYCWGDNEVGAVGDGTMVDRFVPAPVTGGLSFSSLESGFRHTCGRTNSGTVYCWGSNGAGQLGNNTNSPSAVPVKVVGQP